MNARVRKASPEWVAAHAVVVATTPEELGEKVKAAFAARVPCLIDVQAPFEP